MEEAEGGVGSRSSVRSIWQQEVHRSSFRGDPPFWLVSKRSQKETKHFEGSLILRYTSFVREFDKSSQPNHRLNEIPQHFWHQPKSRPLRRSVVWVGQWKPSSKQGTQGAAALDKWPPGWASPPSNRGSPVVFKWPLFSCPLNEASGLVGKMPFSRSQKAGGVPQRYDKTGGDIERQCLSVGHRKQNNMALASITRHYFQSTTTTQQLRGYINRFSFG